MSARIKIRIETSGFHACTYHKICIRPIINVLTDKVLPAFDDGIGSTRCACEEFLVDVPEVRIWRSEAKKGHDEFHDGPEWHPQRLARRLIPTL